MKNLCTAILLFFSFHHISFSQGNKYVKGQLKLLNSPNYMPGLNVKASYNSVDYTDVTKNDGIFLLNLPQQAQVVKEIQVLTNQYEIVEKDDVRNINTTDDATSRADIILICKTGELKKLSNTYFQTLFAKEKEKSDRQIQQLKGTVEQIKSQKKIIEEELSSLKLVLIQQADFYAKFDLSDPIYKLAYQYFLNGEFQKCLEALPTDQQVLAAMNSLQHAKNRIIRTNLLKANSYEGLKDHANADKWFQKAISTDELNLNAYISYASVLGMRNDYSNAVKNRLKAIRICEALEREDNLFAAINYKIAGHQMHYNLHKDDSALILTEKSIEYYKKAFSNQQMTHLEFMSRQADIFSFMGDVYSYGLNDQNKAIVYYKVALDLHMTLKGSTIESIENCIEAAISISDAFLEKESRDRPYIMP